MIKNADTTGEVLTRLRRQLIDEGYSVEVRPRIGRGDGDVLCPDLMAVKDGTALVYAIRADGGGAPEADRLRRLAQAAQDEAGWQFRLILPEHGADALADLPDLDDVRARLADARRLYRKGDYLAGFMLAWGLLGAAGRVRLSRFGAVPGPEEPPGSFVKTLIVHGLADPEDEPWLSKVALLYERLAGGQVTLAVPRDHFDRLCAVISALAGARQGEIDDGRPRRDGGSEVAV